MLKNKTPRFLWPLAPSRLVIAISALAAVAVPKAMVLAATCSAGNQTVNTSFDVGCKDTPGNNVIYSYLDAVLRFLAGGVGLVIVLMIIISGIQFITSSGNPQAIQAARGRLTNAVIALILFIFMAAILNFVVPGGLL